VQVGIKIMLANNTQSLTDIDNEKAIKSRAKKRNESILKYASPIIDTYSNPIANGTKLGKSLLGIEIA